MKEIFFLSGFPRAGNTLLSTILNQNKDIASTGHSILPDIFFEIEKIKNYNGIYQNFKTKDNLENIQKNIFKNYYQPWKQKYVIDRGEWATPFNYSMLEKYCPNEIKIIFLLRDPIDVIKSYLELCNKYPNFYINNQYNSLDPTSLHKSEIEEKIELITKKDDLFDTICMSYNFIKNKKNVKFIHYKKLVTKPQSTIDEIYNFLDIPKFKHTFNIKNQFSINNISYNDDIIGAPIHTLHEGKVKNFSHPGINIPSYIIKKYERSFYD